MPTIFFGGNSGKTFAKKRKRMPGTNKDFKPEMKAYDAFDPSSAADVYSKHYFMNMVMSTTTVPANTHLSWYPFSIAHPSLGTGSLQRIGKNYLLRFLKFKGAIIAHHNCNMPINWRLCLCRLEKPAVSVPNRAGYIAYFVNTATNTLANVADTELFCLHNYYMKLKVPEYSNEFKRKVIASGTIPKNYESFDGEMPGGTAGSLAGFRFKTRTINENLAAFYPFDVSVTLNDNIDVDTMRYFIVLETDIGYGILGSGTGGDNRTVEYDDRQFELQIFCKGYFEDY